MSEPNENVTKQPDGAPRSDAITDQPPPHAHADEPNYGVPPKSRMRRFVLRSLVNLVLLLVAGALAFALFWPTCANVKHSAMRAQSMNNCKQMCMALNAIASNSTTCDIPPSYGPFPAGGADQSFFVSLLPYIGEQSLYANWPNASNTPVKTYIAPLDPNNPATNALISYGSNATALTVGGNPTLPGSFRGRTSTTIVVFERTAKCGATWSSSNSYLLDANGNSSPEFGKPSSWSGYGNRATAISLLEYGCMVGMGDGSARYVTQASANAGWAWAMDPKRDDQQPLGW